MLPAVQQPPLEQALLALQRPSSALQPLVQPLPTAQQLAPVTMRLLSPLQVYSRRRPRRRAEPEEEGAAIAQPNLQPPSPASVFILKLSQTPNGLLPIPHISKRRKRNMPPPSEAPRRSQRLAGMGVEKPEVCPVHLKKV
jgi:hypothetical protein